MISVSSPRARRQMALVIVLITYISFGIIGLLLGDFWADHLVVVWPASGWALGATIGLSRAISPAVWTGAFLTMLAASGNVLWAMIMAVGLALEPIVSAALIDRFARGTEVFRRPDSIFRFFIIVALTGAPVTATTAGLASVVAGMVPWYELAYVWMTWWLASLAGTLIVTPLALLWAAAPVTRVRVLAVLEAVVILAALAGVSLVVFAGLLPTGVHNYPLEFLCVPFLLWAAFRQGRRAVSLAAALLCGIAAWGTMRGYGPFVRYTEPEAIVLVQAYMVVMSTMGAVIAAVVAEHRHASEQLRELATTDPLTGLANYRRLLEVLRAEIARSNRTGRAFSVLFLDMNGLKGINDRYGHLAGSRALCRLANTLKASCRSIDTPARFGGDEFAIVLPETPEEGGYVVLSRITERLVADTDPLPLSVSGGVAVFPRDGASPTQLLRAADTLLYASKTRAAARRDTEHDAAPRTGT